MEPMRLQKFMARSGVASRRASEAFIEQGRVRVNGAIVTELGRVIDPEIDTITLDDRPLALPSEDVVYMLHKPAGVVSTMSDPYERRTVRDFLPLDRYPSLFPIGRLDFDTTGLLLFATDGALGNGLLHPRQHVAKTYIVTVKGVLSREHIQAFERGIQLDDGVTAPAHVSESSVSDGRSVFKLTIHEGKKREIRRMCSALHLHVLALHRITFAGVSLGDLKEGHIRKLTDAEISLLYTAAGLRNPNSKGV